MRWKSHVRFGGRAGETHRSKDGRALQPDPYTYIPVRHGFRYLVAIIDWASRHVLAQRLSNRKRDSRGFWQPELQPAYT